VDAKLHHKQVIKRSKAGRGMLQQQAVTILRNLFLGNGNSSGTLSRLLFSRFSRWKSFMLTERAREAQQLQDLVKRCAYKWLALSEIALRRRLLVEQKARVAAIVRKRVEIRLAAASKLQRRWRGKVGFDYVVRLRKEQLAIGVIQRSARCFVARRELHRRKIAHKLLEAAAIVVQVRFGLHEKAQ